MDEKLEKFRTGFLYSDPSFVKGMGTTFNVWGNYYNYNYSDSGMEADNRALASDWNVVGKDLEKAMSSKDIRSDDVEKVAA
jgi:hypothetical protein